MTEQLHEMCRGQSSVQSGSKIELHLCGWCAQQYLAELLFQCSLLCRCQVWPAVQKWWQAISKKLSTHYTQGFGCNCYALVLSKLCFFFFSSVDRVCVGGLGCSAKVGESKRFLHCCVQMTGIGNITTDTHPCVLSLSLSLSLSVLPPAMSSSSSCICRWKIFSWRSHRVCFIFSLRVTM